MYCSYHDLPYRSNQSIIQWSRNKKQKKRALEFSARCVIQRVDRVTGDLQSQIIFIRYSKNCIKRFPSHLIRSVASRFVLSTSTCPPLIICKNPLFETIKMVLFHKARRHSLLRALGVVRVSYTVTSYFSSWFTIIE